MAAPSVTYTFTNGTTADGTQANTNFTDLINGSSDGTKDYTIAALTAGGVATFNGAVTLGNAAGDDITITGSLASSIAVKTTATYNVGAATLGLLSIYFGRNSQTVRIIPSASMSATYTMTLPVTAGTKGQVMQTDGTAVMAFVPGQTDINAVASAAYIILDTDGYRTINVTTGNTDRTITLPTAADNTDRTIHIKKVDSGTGEVNLVDDNSDAALIDGSAQIDLYRQYQGITVVSDGSTWHVLDFNWISYYETDSLSADAYSGTIHTFTTVVGRFYRLTLSSRIVVHEGGGSDGTVVLTVNDDSQFGGTLLSGGTEQTETTVERTYLRTAASTTFTVAITGGTTNEAGARGNNGQIESYATIEELNPYLWRTADFTP